MLFRSQSIILRRIPYGEADLVVTFFSRDNGRMSGMAKSARKSMRRFGGALEPGTLVEMLYSERQSSELVFITEAQVKRSVVGIMKSLERIDAMGRALILALGFLRERQSAPEKFDLLDKRITYLSNTEPTGFDSLVFEIEWLRLCGFGPNIHSCSLCKGELDGSSWSFDFDEGGVICPNCSGRRGRCVSLGDRATQVFRHLGEGEISDDNDGVRLAQGVVGQYINHILGRSI